MAILLPSSPIVDLQTGQMATEWRNFFLAIAQNNQVSTGSLQSALNAEIAARQAADAALLPKSGGTTGSIGFHGNAPVATAPSVSGHNGSNEALNSLLFVLGMQYGLVTDNSVP